MKNFEIKITGSGSEETIKRSISKLIEKKFNKSLLFEDDNLVFEINESGNIDEIYLEDRRFLATIHGSEKEFNDHFIGDEFNPNIRTFKGLKIFFNEYIVSSEHHIKYLQHMHLSENLSIKYNPDFNIERIK